MNYITINDRREVMWDDFLADADKTTAKLTLNHPAPKEIISVQDYPWEGDGISYPHVVKFGDVYRMYYITTISDFSKMVSKDGIHEDIPHCFCCMESTDGIHWIKPSLSNVQWEGYDKNNAIIHAWLDNFYVFIDENANCSKEEKVKGLAAQGFRKDKNGKMFSTLWMFRSKDGIHFEKSRSLIDDGQFDSLNTAHWNEYHQKYMCFYRKIIGDVRSVYYAESTDFVNWTEGKPLTYSDNNNFALYTNGVNCYYRAPHMLAAFPTRYVERHDWSANYDQLPWPEGRKNRMTAQPRYGLALTDAMFMSSRDGQNWHRFPEAYMTPGSEWKHNWAYGDAYLSVGMVETPDEHGNTELSMYAAEGAWSGEPNSIRRYTIRLDGFACYHGDYGENKLITKPIIFDGNELEINFKTSAIGSLHVNLLDENGVQLSGYKGIELFGDNTSRIVYFENGCDVSNISGKPIRMEIILSDADIYSFKFNKK